MSNALAPQMTTIGLPKVRECDGKGIYTKIQVSWIVGFEPCTLTYKGKIVGGTKVYTNKNTSFKVLCEPNDFDAAWTHLSLNGGHAQVGFTPAIGAVPMLVLPAVTGAVKILKGGK